MNSQEKILLIGEELVVPEQKELLLKLKKLLQELTAGKAGDRRKYPLVIVKIDGCWDWNGTVSEEGYGQLYTKYKKWMAHRYFFKKLNSDLILGLVIDHLCRNRRCINPKHLEQVTNKENLLRGIGSPAQNARKTHCKRGHEFTHENITIIKSGKICKICKRRLNWNWNQKNRNINPDGIYRSKFSAI